MSDDQAIHPVTPTPPGSPFAREDEERQDGRDHDTVMWPFTVLPNGYGEDVQFYVGWVARVLRRPFIRVPLELVRDVVEYVQQRLGAARIVFLHGAVRQDT